MLKEGPLELSREGWEGGGGGGDKGGEASTTEGGEGDRGGKEGVGGLLVLDWDYSLLGNGVVKTYR